MSHKRYCLSYVYGTWVEHDSISFKRVSIVVPGGFKTKEYDYIEQVIPGAKPQLSAEQKELSFVGVRDGKIYFVREKLK